MGTGPTEFWLTDDPNDSDRDKHWDKTPDTPPDKPRPPRVEEPPPQLDSKGPYVVRAN